MCTSRTCCICHYNAKPKNKFAEIENLNTFLHAITTSFKREATEFETADDMYRDNNALSIRKRVERIAWYAKDGQPSYRNLAPGSGYFVLETNPLTLKEETIEVSLESWCGYQARMEPEKWINATRVPDGRTPDGKDRFRNKLEDLYGADAAERLETFARNSLLHPSNEHFREKLLAQKPAMVGSFESIKKILQDKRLTPDALQLKPVQPQYRDMGVRFDPSTKEWVQNNSLYNRHLIAGEAELQVTGQALGKLYDVYIQQKYTCSRHELQNSCDRDQHDPRTQSFTFY